ncbi:hypothetical protein HPC49_20740 [Pyxidicoccus fallax]|uniref:Uncharacterized protein n=1 Tax=Pyxidicoccus fallax TaxID=394095 RepID=A0A848L9E5_9BACT|nr:hypothetical protein [Pyxidicoccus fallax]NMO15640.1 hypothetical protein [Pyxidicoccus fallax]NPC80640.1 hypothetical protein [Pyxidicoccus fallax]
MTSRSGAHSLTDLLVVVLVAQATAPSLTGESKGLLDSLLRVATLFAWSVALGARRSCGCTGART